MQTYQLATSTLFEVTRQLFDIRLSLVDWGSSEAEGAIAETPFPDPGLMQGRYGVRAPINNGQAPLILQDIHGMRLIDWLRDRSHSFERVKEHSLQYNAFAIHQWEI